jgi:CheY-like chemotaxis protein
LLETVYRTGKLLADTFFNGDPKAWSRKNKGAAFARLEACAELRRSRPALRTALRVYDTAQRVPAILTSDTLKLSHVLAVLRLAEDVQSRLLEEAHIKGLTVRQLRQLVKEAATPAKTGRPETPQVLKTLALLRSLKVRRALEGKDSLAVVDRRTADANIPVCDEWVAALLEMKEQLMQAAAAAAAAAAATVHRVLVVDPDPVFTPKDKRKFRADGWIVQTARSCAEALARMDPRTDCAVVNLVLPDGPGRDLVQRLREIRPKLRWIYLTEHPKTSLPEPLRDLFPLEYKSSGQTQLKASLKKVLSAPPPPTGTSGI